MKADPKPHAIVAWHQLAPDTDGLFTCKCGWFGQIHEWSNHTSNNAPTPQRLFKSWVEPFVLSIPLMLQCDVKFRRILDYTGHDSHMIEIILPPEIRGNGILRLPREIFTDAFNAKLPEIPKRKK